MTARLARVARFRLDPARRDEVLAAYVEYEQAVRAEDGMRVWEVCTDAGGESMVWIFVRASNIDALAAHRSSDAATARGAVLIPAIGGAPELHDLVPRFSSSP